MATEAPVLLKPDEAIELLKVSRAQFYNLVREGVIPSLKLGKSIRVPLRALEAFIENNTRQQAG